MTAAVGAPVKWVAAHTLAALAAHGKQKRGDTFTIDQLRAWVPSLGQRARYATDTLKRSELIATHTPGTYKLTAAGAEAVKAAAAGKVLKSGAHGPKGKPPAPDSFAARLWALLRARHVLDTESAASTLIDVGDDVASGEARAQTYLRKWERAGFVASSKKRLAGGRKQFVLVKDQPHAPTWAELEAAIAAAASTQGS